MNKNDIQISLWIKYIFTLETNLIQIINLNQLNIFGF